MLLEAWTSKCFSKFNTLGIMLLEARTSKSSVLWILLVVKFMKHLIHSMLVKLYQQFQILVLSREVWPSFILVRTSRFTCFSCYVQFKSGYFSFDQGSSYVDLSTSGIQSAISCSLNSNSEFWIIDSGANDHICSSIHLFHSVYKIKLIKFYQMVILS